MKTAVLAGWMLPLFLTPLARAGDPASNTQVSTLTAQGAPTGRYGTSVAVSGDLVVVGAPNGGAGLVHVLRNSNPALGPQPVATLVAGNAAPFMQFGAAVAVADAPTGSVIVVGAPSAPGGGQFEVFHESTPDTWTSKGQFQALDTMAGDKFGAAVDVDHTSGTSFRIAVGAPSDDHASLTFAGSVYTYGFDGSNVTLTQKIVPADTHLLQAFGTAVAFETNYLLIGAPGDSQGGNSCGAVYSYLPINSFWTQQTKELPQDAEAFLSFGTSLDGDQARFVAGAPGHDGNGSASGAAYVFRASGADWVQDEVFVGQAGAQLGRSVHLIYTSIWRLLAGGPNGGLVVAAVSDASGNWGAGSFVFQSAPDGATGVQFGAAVARSSNGFLVVGAPSDVTAGPFAGAVYAFETQPPATSVKVLPANATAGDQLGTAAAVDGDLAVFGARQESDTGFASGAAYVWERTGSSWAQLAKLTAGNDAAPLEAFGSSVAVSGDTVAVGAPSIGSLCGDVQVFRRNGTAFDLELDTTFCIENMGRSIALSGDRLAAGAEEGVVYWERTGSTWNAGPGPNAPGGGAQGFGAAVALEGTTMVVGAPESDVHAPNAGAAYVFMKSFAPTVTTWTFVQELVPPGPAGGDEFGNAVALSGDRIVVGAHLDDGTAPDAGSVHVFRRTGSVWQHEVQLDAPASGGFGTALAVDGLQIVVGAPYESSAASLGGAGHLFRWTGASWAHAGALAPGPLADGDRRGFACAITGDTVLLGAPLVDVGAPDAGAVHVFDLPEGPRTYCQGKTNSAGCVPFVSATGVPSASDPSAFDIVAHDVVPNEAGFLLYGFQKGNLSFHGGKLCVKLPFVRTPLKTPKKAGGTCASQILRRDFNATIQSGADPALTVGQTVFAQWRQRDPADPASFGDSLTNAVQFQVCP